MYCIFCHTTQNKMDMASFCKLLFLHVLECKICTFNVCLHPHNMAQWIVYIKIQFSGQSQKDKTTQKCNCCGEFYLKPCNTVLFQVIGKPLPELAKILFSQPLPLLPFQPAPAPSPAQPAIVALAISQ